MSYTKKSVFFKNNTTNNKDYKVSSEFDENIYKDLATSLDSAFEKYEDLDTSKEWISTSQLKNIDFSDFSQHTFFDSAVHKVVYAFNEISNFPYDRKESEVYKFFNKIDGYTNYILESVYPKHVGGISFTGNEKVTIKDQKGFWLNDYDNKTAQNIGSLSLIEGNASIRFWIDLSNCDTNINNQIIFKKVKIDQENRNIVDGYFCFLDFDSQQSAWYIYFCFCQNSVFKIKKLMIENLVSHITINLIIDTYRSVDFDFLINGNKSNAIDVYKNKVSLQSSDNIEYLKVDLTIGSGENQYFDNNPINNFTGVLDEFIIKNIIDKSEDVKIEKDDNIFTNKNVLVYLKFNEPGGNHLNSSLVVDSSGNKLHGLINDLEGNVILDTSELKTNNSLLKKENKNFSPVIIGSFPGIVEERQKLISIAEIYDVENSNIIFKLMPRHYFIDSSSTDNVDERFGYDTNLSSSEGIGIVKNKENSHLVNICLIWARHFDQLKLFVDSISNLFVFNYEDINKEKYVNFQIKNLCKIYNIEYSELFDNLSSKNIKGQYLQNEDTVSKVNIIKLQNILWKRILLNSQDILSSKGTENSIKNIKNSLGFNFNKFVNVSEKSHRNIFNLKDVNISTKKDLASIYTMSFENFSDFNIEFNPETGLPISYPYLVFDNIENYDEESSVFKGLDNKWSLEVYFKLNDTIKNDRKIKESLSNKSQYLTYQTNQSILRLDVNEKCFMNLFLTFKDKDSEFCDLVLDIDPISGYRKNSRTVIENINPYDLANYVNINFSFDKEKDLDHDVIDIQLTFDKISSYDTKMFYKNSVKKIEFEKGIYTHDNLNFFRKENTRLYTGPYLYDIDTVNLGEINDITSEELTPVTFEGQICCINVWNKTLEEKEISIHKNDILNLSLKDIDKTKNSLLCRAIKTIYKELDSNSDKIGMDSVSNFLINKNIQENNFVFYNIEKKNFKKEKIRTVYNNIDLDNSTVNNNVLINNFTDDKNKLLYNNFNEDQHRQDRRFSYIDQYNIDFSSSKIINDNIRKIYGNIESFSKTIQGSKNLYSYEYHNLKSIRSIYFDNYIDSESFDNRSLLDIFKYFDNIMNNTVNEMIPGKIKYAGFNFVFESNVLERSKYHHKNQQKSHREPYYSYKP